MIKITFEPSIKLHSIIVHYFPIYTENADVVMMYTYHFAITIASPVKLYILISIKLATTGLIVDIIIMEAHIIHTNYYSFS